MIGPEVPAHFLQNTTAQAGSEGEEEGPSIGPQIPAELHTQGPHLGDSEKAEETIHPGPQIPTQRHDQQQQEEEEEEEEDDYMPALPPEIAAERAQAPASIPKPLSPSTQSTSTRPPRRPIGPSFPSYGPTYDPSNAVDDDSDDDVGPKPLPAGVRHIEKDPVAEFMEREERRRKNEEEAKKPKPLKRDEWMLVPPSASDLLGKLDTTKLKPRQFARTSGPVNKLDNNLWTETPAERQQRIADEVSGKKRRAIDIANDGADAAPGREKRNRRDEEFIRRGVDEYTKKLRGPSLVQQHTARGERDDEDESKKVIWEHGRDMALGGRLMDDGKRNQMIRESKGLGDRFGSGKGGSFL